MLPPLIYVGGDLATNAYLIPTQSESAYLCFDAPEGLANEIRASEQKIEGLILTHGHSDHIWDAALIARDQGCPVYLHAGDLPLIRRDDSRFPHLKAVVDLPVPPHGMLEWRLGGRQFTLFHIPGHSKGSVVFYERAESRIFAGDVIFSQGIGRTTTQEAREELLAGIRRHLFNLPGSTGVYSGHGPSATLQDERGQSYFS